MNDEPDPGAPTPLPPVAVLLSAETTGELGLVMHLLRPFTPEPASHRHPRHSEVCYVLEGSLAASVGEETLVLHTGEVLLVPIGIGHAYWNPTATLTRLLLIYAPGASAEGLHRLALGEADEAGAPWDTS